MPLKPERDTAPVVVLSPQRAKLHDLKTGEVHTKGTSYVGQQNEVRDMVNATNDPAVNWPGLWYEIRQGGEDFNDWSLGPIETNIYVYGKAEPITLQQFASDRKRGKKDRVTRVDTCNYIRDGQGLRPGNVALTLHEEKSEMSTLGAHGRGLKIGTTAVCAGNLGKGVSYESYVPEIGSWYGEAGVVPDPVDSHIPPSLQLRYKRDQELVVDKTIISVLEPSQASLEALARLPDWFLPANPAYQRYRAESTNVQTIPNRFTVFADRKLAGAPNTSSFRSNDLAEWSGNSGQAVGNEPPRVEILPKEILPNCPSATDYVFVDGLKVRVPGAKFSQVYAFWGFGKCQEGFKASRSNDSLRMDGNVDSLLAETLSRCDNPQVFSEILQANMGDPPTNEANIRSFLFTYELADHPEAREALTKGWEMALKETNAPSNAYVTSSSESYERAKREDIPCVFINSRVLVEGLVSSVKVTKTVDSIFEQRAEEERRRHVQELIRLRQEQEEFKRKEDQRLQEALEKDRAERGVKKEASDTGEVLKIANPENISDSAEIAKLHLIYNLGLNNGVIAKSKVPGSFVLDMEAGDFDRLPNNTDDLGPVSPFIKNFLAAYGVHTDLEVRVVRNGQGVFFKFSRSDHADNFGNLTISVQQGVTAVSDENLLRISITPSAKSLNEGTAVTNSFRQVITDAITPLMDQDHVVSRDKYLQSEHYNQYPPAAAMIRTRRQMEEAKKEARAALAGINAVRIRAGLPPFADPFAEPEKPKVSINNPRPADTTPGFPPGTADIPKPKEPAPRRNDRAFEGQIMEDIPIVENVLYLIHPDSIPGLSRHGKERRRSIVMDNSSASERTRQNIAEKIQEALKRRVSPDFTLASGEFSKERGYLISHFSPAYSEISTEDYEILPPVPFTERNNLTHLRFNKTIKPGLSTLMCPPGCRPVAFHHSKEHPQIIFSGNTERNVYAFTSQTEIPPGLTIYYEKTNHTDASLPDAKERDVVADFDGLNGHWKDLITALNETPGLTDKNKVDILLRAWTKAFTYSDTQETFDLYDESRAIPKTFATEVINHAAGNCGYCDRGFHGLLSLAGIPSRDVACFLSDGFGNFSLTNSYHGINQPYINGQWVFVEPQAGYIDSRFEMEEIPKEHRQKFNELLDAVPEGKSKSPRFIDGLPEVLPSSMPPISTLTDDMIDVLSQQLHFTVPKPREIAGFFTSQIDMYGKKKLGREALKLTIISGSAALVIAKVGPMVSELISSGAQAAAPVANAIESTPVPTLEPIITNPAVQEVIRQLPSIPTEYVAAGVLIGTAAFYTGVFVERKRHSKKRPSPRPQPVNKEPQAVPTNAANNYNLNTD